MPIGSPKVLLDRFSIHPLGSLPGLSWLFTVTALLSATDPAVAQALTAVDQQSQEHHVLLLATAGEFPSRLRAGQDDRVIGDIEKVDKKGRIKGWASTIDDPSLTRKVKLYIDGTFVGKAKTKSRSKSVQRALCDGCGLGFRVRAPDEYRDGGRHEIELRLRNGSGRYEFVTAKSVRIPRP